MDGRENKEDVFTLLSRIFVCWFGSGRVAVGGAATMKMRNGCLIAAIKIVAFSFFPWQKQVNTN